MDANPLVLTPTIALVGGGWLGPEISHPSDANVYLVHDRGEAVLVDAGCGLGSAEILAGVGLVAPQARITAIVVTHAHADHAAGAAALSSATGAPVLASASVAAVLDGTNPERSGLERAQAQGLYPTDVAFTPLQAEVVADRHVMRVGTVELTFLLTEGHADGHLGVLAREADGTRSAFTGDLVFARGRAALLDDSDETDLTRWEQSVRRVAAMAPHRLLAGHGTPVLRRATHHLTMALQALDAGTEPPRLIDSDSRPRRDRP